MQASSSQAPTERTSPLVWVAFVVVTLVFALSTTWPFYNAWKLRYSPAYLASSEWVLTSAAVGEIVGENRSTENDTFPKGGAEDGKARFEHRLVGTKLKAKVAVLLEEEAGTWKVRRAALETDEGAWQEIPAP
ncbi:MAG: hypothetical protein ACK4YP_16325 [Myxococcota bacterium]